MSSLVKSLICRFSCSATFLSLTSTVICILCHFASVAFVLLTHSTNHSSPHWFEDNNHMHQWKTCCWNNEEARGWVREWNTGICFILGIFENIFVFNLRWQPFLSAFPDCQFFSYSAQTLHSFTVCWAVQKFVADWKCMIPVVCTCTSLTHTQ